MASTLGNPVQDLDRLLHTEWLCSNMAGDYASGTVIGCNNPCCLMLSASSWRLTSSKVLRGLRGLGRMALMGTFLISLFLSMFVEFNV